MMDKTTLFNATTVHRGKHETDSAKPQQSDSSLCDDIHNNMRMLAFFYPFSDGLKENFELGMFIKSNTKAFPHVMKYLFTILDPNEFKKKFCWPLYNKAAEATFRNSSLEFLIKLNAKYKLQFGELKNKIVVFPGGADFMRIVVELTKLAMRVTLKRNGVTDSSVAISHMSLCTAAANKRLHEMQTLYDGVMDYTSQLQTLGSEVKERTKRLRRCIDDLAAGTNITTIDMLHPDFCANWQETQNQIIENGVQPHMQRLKAFRTTCERLEVKVNAMVKKQSIKYDAELFNGFIDGMRQLYPTHFHQLSNCAHQHHNINIKNLLLAFRLALPSISNDIHLNKPPSLDVIGYEARGVEKLALQMNSIVHRTAMIETQINHIMGNSNGLARERATAMTNTNNMKSMIFATPAISMTSIKRRGKKRISLMKENVSVRKISTFNASFRPIRSMTIEELPKINGDESPTRGRCTANTSKLNPMRMLRTIEKNSRFCQPTVHSKRIDSPKFAAHHTLPMFSAINAKDDIVDSSSILHADRSEIDMFNQPLSSPTHHHHKSGNNRKHLSPIQSGLLQRSLIDDEQSPQLNDFNRSPSGRLRSVLLAERDTEMSKKSITVYKETTMKMVLNADNKKMSLFHLINDDDESLNNISDTILSLAND